MLKNSSTVKKFRDLISQHTVILPGVFNAITAMLTEQQGFEAIYLSGAALANGTAGYPDIGLMTLEEAVRHARYVTNAVTIPVIVDADTGYGEALNVMRTVREFERIGVAGIHIEDQVSPKKCGHLDGIQLVAPEVMIQKIEAAVKARTDTDFFIIARTDARGVEGIDKAIARAKAYAEHGADMIFPEALQSKAEFREFSRKVDAPLLANMTEFGRTPYITAKEFEALGYNAVIFPLTVFRVMLKAVEDCLREIKKRGSQKSLLKKMKNRQELYQLLKYSSYETLDRELLQVGARKWRHRSK